MGDLFCVPLTHTGNLLLSANDLTTDLASVSLPSSQMLTLPDAIGALVPVTSEEVYTLDTLTPPASLLCCGLTSDTWLPLGQGDQAIMY